MNSITLTKPDGTPFQVNDRRRQKPQLNFQTFKSGHVINSNPEPLLPTGVSREKEDEKDVQTNQKVEKLYPLGINPEV